MKLTEERKEEVLALCKKLISIRSYSGEEKGVADALKDFMKEKKFDQITTDKYGNVIGQIKGTKPGRKVLFDGHMDTVPADNKNISVRPAVLGRKILKYHATIRRFSSV